MRVENTGARGANIDYLGVSAGAVDPDPSPYPWWPESSGAAVLPAFSPYQTTAAQYIEVFNRGSVSTDSVGWKTVTDIGRTGDGVTPWPVTAPSQVPGPAESPHLEYDATFTTAGPLHITTYMSPRNAALASDGLRYAISVDDGEPQIVDVTVGADDGV